MKNWLIILTIIWLSNDMMAQKRATINVPGQVTQAFANRFPSVMLIKWDSGKEIYSASFNQNGHHVIAYFTPGGDWVKTETIIRHKKNLPAQVRQGLNQSPYSSWFVDNILETRSNSPDMVTIDVSEFYNYETGQMEVYRLYFTMEGKLIKKEKLPVSS